MNASLNQASAMMAGGLQGGMGDIGQRRPLAMQKRMN